MSKTKQSQEVSAPENQGQVQGEAEMAITPKAKKAKAPKEPKPQGKCSFIDELYIAGGKTQAEILAEAVAHFKAEGGAVNSLKNTVATRPSHLKAKGYQIQKADGKYQAVKA